MFHSKRIVGVTRVGLPGDTATEAKLEKMASLPPADPELDSRFAEVNRVENDPAAHVAAIASLSVVPGARERMKSLLPRLVRCLKPEKRALWKDAFFALSNLCEDSDVNVRFIGTLSKPSELLGVVLKKTLLEPSDDPVETRNGLFFLSHMLRGSINARYGAEDAGIGKLLFQFLEPRVLKCLDAYRQLDPTEGDASETVDPNGIVSACLAAMAGLMLSKAVCREYLASGMLRLVHLILKGPAKVSESMLYSICQLIVVQDFAILSGLDNRRALLWRFMREYFEDVKLLRTLSEDSFDQLLNVIFVLDKGGVYASSERYKTLFEFGIVDIMFEMMGVAGTENGLTKPQVRMFMEYLVQLCDQKSLLQALYDRDIVGSLKKLFPDLEMAKTVVDTFRFLANYDEDGEHAQDWLADPDVMDYFARMVDLQEDVEVRKSATTLVGNLARSPLVVAKFVTDGFHRNLANLVRYCVAELKNEPEGYELVDLHALLFRAVFALSGILDRAKSNHLAVLFDADHLDDLVIEMLGLDVPLICHFYMSHSLLHLIRNHPHLAQTMITGNYDILLNCFKKQGQHFRVRLDILKVLDTDSESDEDLRGRLMADDVFSVLRLLMNSGLQDDIIMKTCRFLMLHDDGPEEDEKEGEAGDDADS